MTSPTFSRSADRYLSDGIWACSYFGHRRLCSVTGLRHCRSRFSAIVVTTTIIPGRARIRASSVADASISNLQPLPGLGRDDFATVSGHNAITFQFDLERNIVARLKECCSPQQTRRA